VGFVETTSDRGITGSCSQIADVAMPDIPIQNQRGVALTKNQIRGFWAAWSGVALDGMDSFIYALVLVPAMRDLLPRSGIEPNAANLGYYGSILFSVFLIGWGCAFLWGPLADRFGRVRALVFAVLCYSAFTFLGCVARNIWELALFRLLAGFGVGGEFVGAAVFVAEELPSRRRASWAGYLNSAFYVGMFIAAILNHVLATPYGWRAMFVAGGLPALFIAFLRYGVQEPERWRRKIASSGGWTARESFAALFSREYRKRTGFNCLFLLISMVGLWAASVYVPGAVTEVARRSGYDSVQSARLASWATMLLAAGTIAGCLIMPLIADRVGRRGALVFFFGLMAPSIAIAFGYAFYLDHYAIACFISCLFFVGVGGGSFALYLVWLPEQYRTECRGSAFAFATCVGRFAAAGATFLVGEGVSRYGSIGVPVAVTSIAFVVGIFAAPFGVETKGKPLPP
jgi:MFS family permease